MGKDENVTRVDLRIPNEVYEEIERIAILTDQPYTPKSKNTDNPKPIVTPVLLKGLELVLTRLKEDLISELTEGKVSDTEIIKANLEDRIFNRLEKKLEALFEKRLDEILAVKLNELRADTITPDIEPHSENEITPEDINSESAIEPNSEIIEVKSEAVNEDVSALEDTNDNSENDINPEDTEAKTFEDTENEIKKLLSQGLNYSQIAKNLTEGNYPTKKGSYKWSGNQVKRILEKL